MKTASGGGFGVAPSKRRWRGLAVGVLFLVVLSMLVPLGFLLGFHSSGFLPAKHIAPSSNGHLDNGRNGDKHFANPSQGDRASHIDKLVRKLGPTLPKDILGNLVNEAKIVTTNTNATRSGQPSKGTPVPHLVALRPDQYENQTEVGSEAGFADCIKVGFNESGNFCEMKYGSYCHWREENREEMKDAMINKLKDHLFVARAYFPSIAKIPAQNKFSRELRQNIQDFERVLSESATDADLPPQIENKIQKMEAAIVKAKSMTVDCSNVDKKLRQIFDMTEDEANFHMKQSAFLYQLSVRSMPKSLHCLSLKLTVEYFKNHSIDEPMSDKYSDPSLQHYVIFSKNVLASSVVINSTVFHARESQKLVFHMLTDGQNYYAMKVWFFRNAYKDAAVQVLNIEQVNLGHHDKATVSHLPLPIEFRVSFDTINNAATSHNKTEYLSVFSHAHYLLPEIFKNLHRIVVLDDDVVVQKDLSELWSLNMGGKVNGATQICSVRLGHLSSLLGENRFDQSSCAWITGLNVIDLDRWRKLGITESYWRLVTEGSIDAESVLRASLLTFHDQMYALDGMWAVSGLGHDYGLDTQIIKKAALLHYNGNMKPWLELGIPKHKKYWKRFMKRGDQFLSECNVN